MIANVRHTSQEVFYNFKENDFRFDDLKSCIVAASDSNENPTALNFPILGENNLKLYSWALNEMVYMQTLSEKLFIFTDSPFDRSKQRSSMLTNNAASLLNDRAFPANYETTEWFFRLCFYRFKKKN